MNSTYYKITFRINKSSPYSIKKHLLNCDVFFDPPLSSYVSIDEYSKKLFYSATNFEAWNNNQLIGLVSIYCNNLIDKVAYISNVSVEADYQKHGIATRLLLNAINHAKKLGFLHIKLDVYRRNIKAKALYSRLEFKEEKISDNEKLSMIKHI